MSYFAAVGSVHVSADAQKQSPQSSLQYCYWLGAGGGVGDVCLDPHQSVQSNPNFEQHVV